MRQLAITCLLIALLPLGSGCRPTATPPASAASLRVVAIEPFLQDIAQNVAGERVAVDALMPPGADPHSYEPAPQDVAKIADAQVVIINGAGLETFLERLLTTAGGQQRLIEASAGLKSREVDEGEGEGHEAHESDPHFWLDPNLVIVYVENIRDGLSEADPGGAATYAANATAYIAQLQELDQWVAAQVQQIPPERRLLVTNHESFGYYADRYGFRVIGTLIPGASSLASPSAQQLAQLVDQIRATGAPAIFLESGTNPQLAQQVAQEAGVRLVTGLYTHTPGPDAPTYIDMIRYNTRKIVEALR